MNAVHSINSRLDALRGKSVFNQNNYRIISSGKPRDNASNLLGEIDETILARQLNFETSTGARLRLDVVARRVLRVASVDSPESQIAASALIGKPLSESEHLEEFSRLICDFANDVDEISVVSSGLNYVSGSDLVGLPVSRIFKQILVENSQPASDMPNGSPAHNILTQADVANWLIAQGEDAGQSSGDSDVVATLQQLVDDGVSDIEAYLDRLVSSPGDAVCTVIGDMSDKGESILCLRLGNQLAFATVPAGSVQSLVQAWAKENKLN